MLVGAKDCVAIPTFCLIPRKCEITGRWCIGWSYQRALWYELNIDDYMVYGLEKTPRYIHRDSIIEAILRDCVRKMPSLTCDMNVYDMNYYRQYRLNIARSIY